MALLEDLKALRRKGVGVSQLTDERLLDIFKLISEKKANFEAFPILVELAIKPENEQKAVEQIATDAGIGPKDDSEIEPLIKQAHEKVGQKPNLNPLMDLAFGLGAFQDLDNLRTQ